MPTDEPFAKGPQSSPAPLDPSSPRKLLREDGALVFERRPRMSNELALVAYQEMKRIRALDSRLTALHRQGRIGFYGPTTGQEATPIGTALALEPTDWVFPALRESMVMLVRGFSLVTYLAQIFGCEGDLLKGRQMPCHPSAKAVHQVSWSSVIGTQLTHAVGAAWAAKLRKDPVVTIGFLGDGATSSSDFHAAMNFAAVFQVPCVLVCQNNQWAISVPSNRQTAAATFAAKASAYGMPAQRVDGNDVLAVYEVVTAAVLRARRGEGPTFIEALTYRMGPHSSSDDPSRYRSPGEVDQWAQRDPLLRLRRYLANLGLIDDARDAELEKDNASQIAAAIDEVESRGLPDRQSLFDDVYEALPPSLVEQREALLKIPTAPSQARDVL